MDEDDVVGLLQELGLTAYQSRAYVSAVRLGTARPNELAEAAEIPQARIYDVIDDLADMSFVEVHEKSGGKTVSAPPPEVVLESFKESHITEYTRIVDSIAAQLDGLYDDDTRNEGFVTMVSMRESALRHAHQAAEDADFWLSLALNATSYERLRPVIEAALDRGVTARLLLPPGAATDCTFPPGLQVRHHDTTDTLAVADRTHGVFGSAFQDGFETDFVVSEESVLSTLFQDYFEWLWWNAESVVDASSEFPRRYLDPWRAILDLGAGLNESVRVTVTGTEVATGRSTEWTGRLLDWVYASADEFTVAPARATLTVERDGNRFTVGGPKDSTVDVVARGLELDRNRAP